MSKSILDNFTIQEVQHILDNSESYSQALEKLGYKKKSGNFQTLKRYIEEKSLSTTKMEENRKNKIYVPNKHTIPLEKILVEHSKYTNMHVLKKRMLAENMLEYKCAECGIGDIYNNKPLSLQLEHKNGIHDDNRLENLCLLCPNCHSQTETFSGKKLKKKEKLICPRCGGKKYNTSNFCLKCKQEIDDEETIKKFDLDREDLKNKIKTLSFEEIGRRYGVSKNSVKRWCRIFNLPTNREQIKCYTEEEWKNV